MYEAFFGLRERPFDLTPNPRFLLMTATHREALANLQYGVAARKGLTLVLGDAGVGKTTLIRAALEQWHAAGHLVAYINNPTLRRDEFVELLTPAFGLSPAASTSKARFLAELTELATTRHAQGKITALLIDEAQSLSTELLEEIRLLVNIESSSEKMLQVVLAGQPELADRLNHAELRQLKQRIALRCTVTALDVQEAAAYIAGRIHIAGGVAGHVFTREAVMAVHEHSTGIPRVISVICDNTLLAGFAAGRRPVTREMVEEVCRDFDIKRALSLSAPTPPAAASAAPAAPAAATAPAAANTAPAEPTAPRQASPQRSALAATGTTGTTQTKGTPGEGTTGLFEHYAARTKRRFSFF